jgi:glucose-6-phosphate-specific signal transduction histidine kinase
MKYKNFWIYFAFGAIVGLVVGIMKNNFPVWLGVGALLGFLVAILIESKLKSLEPEKIMWFGFILLFPIMFFKEYLKDTVWWDVFGILAVIGSFILIFNFVKMIKSRKLKKKK